MRELDYPEYPAPAGPRLRWSSILAGAVLGLAVLGCLTGLGLGAGFLTPNHGAGPALPGAGASGMIWPWLCGAVSYFGAGWTASRLSDSGRWSDGALYGLIAWSACAVGAAALMATILPGAFTTGTSGLFAARTGVVEAAAAIGGGALGARLYVPVPIQRFRRHGRFAPRERETADV